MIRKPQVAGQFYPASSSALKKQLSELIDAGAKKEDAVGLVSPHAGYMFSGQVAGYSFSRVRLTESVVILGPKHTGQGEPFSIITEGAWGMPMGQVQIDSSLGKRILQESRYLREDFQAHASEHSIEVQLPFLQYLLPEVKIVPIVLADADWQIYNDIGQAIARAVKDSKKPHLIIASSDFSHYLPQEKARQQDNLAIQAILKLDEQELLKRVKKFNITMCGYAPCACMLAAAKTLNAQEARLLKYQTSGDVSGDYSSVVGYAGIIVRQ